MSSPESTTICMIGGTGRSGTTLLRRIFDNHPKVATLPEFYLTVAPGGLYDFYQTLNNQWTPYLFDDRLRALIEVLNSVKKSAPLSKYYRYALRKTGLSTKGLKMDPSFSGVGMEAHCPNYQTLVDGLIENLTDITYDGSWVGKKMGSLNKIAVGRPSQPLLREHLGNFYRSLASSITSQKQASHFVEDNTWNILYFAEILELLPNARMVHIYRDPRDVVASFTRQTWAPSDAVKSARIYKNLMDHWYEVKQNAHRESFLEISLENLVDAPKEILQKVSEFWHLEWDEQLLNLALDKAHTGRWRKDLPDDELDDVLNILEPYTKKLGYE